ncbi:MAG: phosphoenolpyruvate carboxykinase (ATP), partial [Anaerolineae bacterium]|nr:phosphoenolpyruvate carboxykinase (ATP) [Anaerolineae bacterium]
VYANLLGEKLAQHKSKVWLVNTGWTGGAYGVGSRVRSPHTRAMIRAALEGRLDNVSMHIDPFFGIAVPDHVPGVPDEILYPRNTWADPEAYDRQASLLVTKFQENFSHFTNSVTRAVIDSGPRIQS